MARAGGMVGGQLPAECLHDRAALGGPRRVLPPGIDLVLRSCAERATSVWERSRAPGVRRLGRGRRRQGPRIPRRGDLGLVSLGYIALYAIGAIVVLPLYLFLLLPIWLIWPAALGQLQRTLVNMITGGIGDQQAMTNRQVAVAGAADAVAQALWYFLSPDRRDRDDYDTVTVIAHSGGCVVSYAALAREDVQRWLRESPELKRVTWITVGSGLNLAWRMRSRTKAARPGILEQAPGRHGELDRHLLAVRPGAPGPAPHDMVKAIMGETPLGQVGLT